MKFTKRQLCIALHTASQWHGDMDSGPLAMLILSSTRRVNSEEHRQHLVEEIKGDLFWMIDHGHEQWDGGRKAWERDVIRLTRLLEIVQQCEIGHKWLTDDENMEINEKLFQRGLL